MITDGRGTSLITQGLGYMSEVIISFIKLLFKYPNNRPFKKSSVTIEFKSKPNTEIKL